MASFTDLNLNITNLNDKSIDQLVENAIKWDENVKKNKSEFIKVGYDNLGLAVDFEFPAQVQQQAKAKKKEAKAQVSIPLAKTYTLPLKLENRLKDYSRNVNIYSRINIKIKPSDINTYLHHLKSKAVLSYDLISLEPTDSQALLYLCSNNFNADIISINSGIECGLTDKHLIRPLKNAVSSFGLTFELNYSPAISSSTERRDLIMAGRCLSFNTKSKGLILSSRASQSISLRGPYELLNLVKLFDITEQESHQIIRQCPQNVLTNSFCRKHTASGMVYLKNIGDLKKLENSLIAYKRKLENSKSSEQTETDTSSQTASPVKKIKN